MHLREFINPVLSAEIDLDQSSKIDKFAKYESLVLYFFHDPSILKTQRHANQRCIILDIE